MNDQKLSHLFNRVIERHSMIKEVEEKKLFRFMRENTFLEVHCIDFIEKLDDPNVTKLANEIRVTRGAISKTIKKLFKGGYIEKYQRENNKKEIYFQLTEKGKELFHEHNEMHEERIRRDHFFTATLTEQEKEELYHYLTKIYGQIKIKLKENDLDQYS